VEHSAYEKGIAITVKQGLSTTISHLCLLNPWLQVWNASLEILQMRGKYSKKASRNKSNIYDTAFVFFKVTSLKASKRLEIEQHIAREMQRVLSALETSVRVTREGLMAELARLEGEVRRELEIAFFYTALEASREMGMDTVTKYNFGVVGRSGTGKSSLINALLGIGDSDPAGVAVGEVETTQALKQYQHPNFTHIVFWDLPGAGTERNPHATYFRVMKLSPPNIIFLG